MGDFQDKFLGKAKEEVEGRGLDFVKEHDWANKGRVYIQRDFTTLFSFHFDFQPARARLTFYDAEGRQMREQFPFGYGEGAKIEAALAHIRKLLPPAPEPDLDPVKPERFGAESVDLKVEIIHAGDPLGSQVVLREMDAAMEEADLGSVTVDSDVAATVTVYSTDQATAFGFVMGYLTARGAIYKVYVADQAEEVAAAAAAQAEG